MLCESCDENVATVHLTEIVNKEKKELHLCEECAREKGFSVKSHFSVQNLVAGLPGSEKKKEKTPGEEEGGAPSSSGTVSDEIQKKLEVPRKPDALGVTCPVCGMTYAEFRQKGRLGCPKDYEVFRDALVPVLERIHGEAEHLGRIPGHVDEAQDKRRRVLSLRQELNRAIQEEEYEKAARIRDELYALEEEAG